MNSAIKRLTRLAVGGCFVAVLVQACGGLDEGTVTVIPDEPAAGTPATGGKNNPATGGAQANAGSPSAGQGQGGASGGEAGEPGGVGGAVGGAGSECVEGAACADGLDGGLCIDGTCSSCAGAKDDPKCVKGYGKGYLRIEGGCSKADCHNDNDCSSGTCTNHHCLPCTKDADCTAAGTICDTTGGSCVTNPSCGAVPSGSQCPVNPVDICCGPNTFCAPVACCGVDACRTKSDLKDPDGKCKNGQCVSDTCAAPVGTVRYVDPAAPAGGSGSLSCPFKQLAAALQDLSATGGLIIVKFGATITVDSGFSVGPGITIVGSDANFVACTPALCPSASRWPLITTGDHRAINLVTPGNRTLRFLRFVGLEPAKKDTATFAAIYVATASLNIDHVDVSGYQYGVYADTASSVKIGDAVQLHDNHRGLYVADGDGAAGGNVEITVTKEASSFNHNGEGLACHGNGVLKASAPPAGPKLTALLLANDNDGSGVYWSCSVTQGLLDGIEATGNGTDATLDQQDGASLFAHSNIKVRNSYFHDNKGSGVHIPSNGPNTADGLSKIDLGTNLLAGAGKNTFAGNLEADLCIGSGPANAADPNSLAAEGNTFQIVNAECKFSRSSVCTGGVDFSGACSNAADLKGCTTSTATCL